jgi:hypothetical protein
MTRIIQHPVLSFSLHFPPSSLRCTVIFGPLALWFGPCDNRSLTTENCMLALALFSYGFYENTFMEVKGEPEVH